jgi:hypothetical protein
MKVRKIAIGAAATATVLGAAIAGAASAHASVGPVQYTPTGGGANSISGYYAHAINNGIDFSHITSYAGSDGQHTIEQLPVSTIGSPVAINGAAGIGLCNQQTGEAAQVGLVYAGGGLMDVVDATGYLVSGYNGDLCQGGIVNPSGLNSTSGFSSTNETTGLSYTAGSPILTVTSGPTPPLGTIVTVVIPGGTIPAGGVALSPTYTIHPDASSQTLHFTVVKSGVSTFELGTSSNANSVLTVPTGTPQPLAGIVPSVTWQQFAHTPGATFGVLKTGIPDNDTVSLDILYDAKHAYSFKGHSHAAGTVTFAATDLGSSGVSYQGSVTAPHSAEFTEADTGVIDDTQHVVPLSGTPPLPNPGVNGNLNADPNLLEGFSHVTLAGNPANGAAVVEGSLQANSAWTAFPVASSANGRDYLVPTEFREDHFLELVGAPVS